MYRKVQSIIRRKKIKGMAGLLRPASFVNNETFRPVNRNHTQGVEEWNSNRHREYLSER